MLESFGARLRQRREAHGIALAAIADRTKIKMSLLEALERDDVSHWPSGIYRRAYIRAYGQAIGLDPDVIVREFLDVHPEPDDILAAEAIAAAIESARTNGGPPTRLRYIVGSAIGSLARLRRSPGGEGPGFTPEAAVHRPIPAELDFQVVAYEPPDPIRVEAIEEINAGPVDETTPGEPDFMAVAHLCTELGRVDSTDEMQPLLEEAAGILGATGLIVWIWDASVEGLRPAFAHGYSDQVLAQLPTVRREEDNATAAAFRSARTCALNGGDHASGALVAPLLTPDGCAGVLAIELQQGREPTTSLLAVATILAALLAQLAGSPRPADVGPQAETTSAAGEDLHAADRSYPCAAMTGDMPDTAPACGQTSLGSF